MTVSFTVHGKPAPAGSKRAFRHRTTGRVMVVDASPGSRPWKAQVADAAAQAMNGQELHRGPLRLELAFYEPRPKSHLRADGSLNPNGLRCPHPAKRPDLLKLARAVEDALSGVVYADDAQIVTEILVKRWGEPTRVEVRVVPIPEWPAARSEAA